MAIDKNKYLSDKLQNMSQSATIAMAEKARKLKEMGHDVIALSLGEPDFDTPDHIKEAAKQALDEGYTKYTPVNGLLEFRKAIVEKFKRDNDLEYTVEQIVVSNGAKQSIANLCLALLNKGDEVLIFTPYWVSYFDIVTFAGGVPITVKAGIEDDFKVTPKILSEYINDKTKMVIFSSPCNPTGSVYNMEELEALGKVFDRYDDLFIISDEIYEFINFTNKHASLGTIPALKDQVITINGMSKGFAMTGWRLGYMAGPTWLAKACAKVQGQFTSGATSFGQKAASIALQTDLRPTEKMKVAYEKRKKMMIELLNEIPGIKTNDPMGAFYIFPDISDVFGKSTGTKKIANANDFAEFLLTEAHVAVVSGSAFGDDNCIRISYAASEEQLREACLRISKAVKSLS